MALIACVDLDTFLVGLVQRVRPDDDVTEVDARSLLAGRSSRYAAVVMGAQSEAAPHLLQARLSERTVLITSGRRRVPPGHLGPVLRRPVDAADLRVALASVVPPGRFSGVRAWLRTLPVATSIDGGYSVARVTAVASASALAITDPMFSPQWLVLLPLVAWTLLRIWVRENTVGLVSADLVLGGLALMLSGGPTSPFILFAAVVAAEVGYAFPVISGVTLVGAATLAGVIDIGVDMAAGAASTADVIGWGTLIPLSSVIGVLARRIRRGRDSDDIEVLQELHATLYRLSRQAQGVEGSLDTSSVLDQLVAGLQDLGAHAGVVLLGDHTVHEVAASFGLHEPAPARVVLTSPNGRAPRLPEELRRLLPEGTRLTAPLAADGVSKGLLVVCVPQGAPRTHIDVRLQTLARGAGLALDNARLFAGIRELTVDEERRRLARDLHDGVVQSLVHVRFELDLMRRMVESEYAADLGRLRDVVGQAVDEVRGTVNDLRSVRLSAGLGTALTSLAREYERPGMRVVVDAGPLEQLTPESALQLLRIAQEAISNAVHHGEASVVYVRLWEDTDAVHLQVLDNGVGMDPRPVEPGRGVGLRAMQERADLLGATLDLGPGDDGGTCIQVDVPVGRGANP